MEQRLLVLLILLMPVTAFAQSPKYTVSIWEAEFDELTNIECEKNIGTIGIEFNTDVLFFNLERGVIETEVKDTDIIRFTENGPLTIPLIRYPEISGIYFELSAPWHTVIVTERHGNVIVLRTLYKKVFNKTKQRWHWEAVRSGMAT